MSRVFWVFCKFLIELSKLGKQLGGRIKYLIYEIEECDGLMYS